MFIFAAVLAVVAMWFIYSLRNLAMPAQSIPSLVGDGRYAVAVVGESKYTKNFQRICGPRSVDGVNMKVSALLTFEDGNKFDDQAVRVSIKDYTVGYLPQASARDFRRAVAGVGLLGSRVFECDAVIRGSWDDERGRISNYRVSLDLPENSAI